MRMPVLNNDKNAAARERRLEETRREAEESTAAAWRLERNWLSSTRMLLMVTIPANTNERAKVTRTYLHTWVLNPFYA